MRVVRPDLCLPLCLRQDAAPSSLARGNHTMKITLFLPCLLPLSCEDTPLIHAEERQEREKKIPTPPRIHEESLGGVEKSLFTIFNGNHILED